MRVLIVRHAIAEDRIAFAKSGKSDDERPLTAEGHSRMQRAARGLRSLVPTIDLIATSPLKRARQTADIVAAEYETKPVKTVPPLSGDGDLDGVIDWLGRQGAGLTVALVGHEPDLSTLISHLLTGTSSAAVTMKKGAVCLLEFEGEVKAGAAVLRWLLAPKQLRAIGGSDA